MPLRYTTCNVLAASTNPAAFHSFLPPIVLTCVYPLALLLRVNDLFFCAGDRTATDRSLLGGWCELISFGKLNMVDFLGVADATEQTWTEQSQSISIFYSFNWYIGCNNRVYPVANWRTSRLLHHILNTSQHEFQLIPCRASITLVDPESFEMSSGMVNDLGNSLPSALALALSNPQPWCDLNCSKWPNCW